MFYFIFIFLPISLCSSSFLRSQCRRWTVSTRVDAAIPQAPGGPYFAHLQRPRPAGLDITTTSWSFISLSLLSVFSA
jgi:hypothetical protein